MCIILHMHAATYKIVITQHHIIQTPRSGSITHFDSSMLREMASPEDETLTGASIRDSSLSSVLSLSPFRLLSELSRLSPSALEVEPCLRRRCPTE